MNRYQFDTDPLNAAHATAVGTLLKILAEAGIKVVTVGSTTAPQPQPQALPPPAQPAKAVVLKVKKGKGKGRKATRSGSPVKTGIPPIDVVVVSESMDRKLIVRRKDTGEELISNLGICTVLGISHKSCKIQDRKLTTVWVKAPEQKSFVCTPIRGLWEALRGIGFLGIEKFPDEIEFLRDVAALTALGVKDDSSKGPEEVVPQEPPASAPALPAISKPVPTVAQIAAATKRGAKVPLITNNSTLRDINEVVDFLKGSMTHTSGGKCLRIWTPRGSVELGTGWSHVPRPVFRKLNRWVEDQLEAEGRHR